MAEYSLCEMKPVTGILKGMGVLEIRIRILISFPPFREGKEMALENKLCAKIGQN